ncbi:hypothetical protein IRJ41_009190 [Triplophysa rosa]|uniref:Uncharacterized protein n=1 Tax=Triplophysa rosa TaxID=992332 RepID=A0A9W8C6A8_TRIRA|nr:hypothetical protein IRJ41_009190 [Triplophysa rosa]
MWILEELNTKPEFCGGAQSRTADLPWPPPSPVTFQRPVRVGVSVESEEKDGCGTKGEVDKSESHSLRTDRFRRRTKRKTALARTSVCVVGMDYRADCRADDRECRQASHAHTLITGVQ